MANCTVQQLNNEEIIQTLNFDDYCSFGVSNNGINLVVPLIYGFDYCIDKFVIYFIIVVGSEEYNYLQCNCNASGEFEKKVIDRCGDSIIFNSVIVQGNVNFVCNPCEAAYIKSKIAQKSSENVRVLKCLETQNTIALKLIVNNVLAKKYIY